MMHQRMWSWGAARQDAKLGLTSLVRAPHCLVRCKTRWGGSPEMQMVPSRTAVGWLLRT